MKKIWISSIITILILSGILGLSSVVKKSEKEQECRVVKCHRKCETGRTVCNWHICNRNTHSSYSSYSSSLGKGYTNNSSSNYPSRNTSSSKRGSKSSNSSKRYTYDSYDSGYEAVYDDDDYDWDRYYSDDEYANGVDDAIEDLEDEGEDW